MKKLLLKLMSEKHPNKFNWFLKQESEGRTFKKGITYEKIKTFNLEKKLFEDDFNECDSGYCGL